LTQPQLDFILVNEFSKSCLKMSFVAKQNVTFSTGMSNSKWANWMKAYSKQHHLYILTPLMQQTTLGTAP